MPLYQFEILSRAGEVLGEVQLPLRVEERDAVTLRRKPIPNSVGIAGSARNPGETANQVLDAYKRIEQRLGHTSEFRRRIGHSADQVKKAWATE
jgi:hypothetical protein